jgi:hypothetical protein
MNDTQPSFPGLAVKAVVVHTITYFLMGLLAATILDYASRFASQEFACWMRQTDEALVMAGPLFQPIRGLLFASVFYLLREILFGRKYGWLIMWWALVALGILSTFGPAPGSIEGLIYTVIPLQAQLTGLLEIGLQSLLLSAILFYWVRHPEKRWLTWVLGGAFAIVMALPALGLLLT